MESTYFLLVQACKLLTSEKASERKVILLLEPFELIMTSG